VERYSLSVYAELAAIALDAPGQHGVDDLDRALAAHPADRLRRRLLGAESVPNRGMVSDGAFDRAIAGDTAARAELRSTLGLDRTARQAIDRLLDAAPKATRDDIVAIVAEWGSRVFPRFGPAALVAIGRDVEAKRLLLDGDVSGRAALAAATNGVELAPSAWATEIVIVPTVALRPFIAPVESGQTAIIVCSVADDAFDVDAAAPPRRLVKVAAALGDELRLRVLHVLRDEELTASEIAERLGVDRTSLHHHLGILRSAGLLAIRDDGVRGWRYALRRGGLRDVGSALESYLRPPS
ncbi:MAG TPA: metalloregulator ArsR/SmtB family transcription factor, partial [Candidatus Limnocylindrales bacterium]|nr:metalloregulator ArsR/SmtB family transcription factor [Candidatus Limnocylindrales bacterium]